MKKNINEKEIVFTAEFFEKERPSAELKNTSREKSKAFVFPDNENVKKGKYKNKSILKAN